MVATVTGYIFLTDWQAIPYDPCTEYSPFHHPEIVKKWLFNSTSSVESRSFKLPEVYLGTTVELHFDNNSTVRTSLPMFAKLNCKLDDTCPCENSIHFDSNNEIFPSWKDYILGDSNSSKSALCCSYSTAYGLQCVNIHANNGLDDRIPLDMSQQVLAQELQVLSGSTYTIASNYCLNASVPGRQCHWIPFSTITNTKCNDCPPVCRAKEQTMNFAQFIIGMALLFLVFPMIDVPIMSIITNHAPRLNGTQVIFMSNLLHEHSFKFTVFTLSYTGCSYRCGSHSQLPCSSICSTDW